MHSVWQTIRVLLSYSFFGWKGGAHDNQKGHQENGVNLQVQKLLLSGPALPFYAECKGAR